MRRLSILLLPVLAACGGATPHPAVPSSDQVVRMDEMRIVASRSDEGEVVFDSYDAGQLFERGTRLLNEGRCREAVERYYDRIAREFATSRYVGPALYNAGLCLHEGGELEASIPYYRGVLEHAPEGRDARHATLQLLQVYVNLEHWDDGLELAEQFLLREDLQAPERLEGLSRRAQALLGLERLTDAGRQARDALSYYRMQERRGQIQDPYFAAASNYVLAETMRLQAEHIAIPAGDAATQHQALDQRARLVLDAQREYFNTIRQTDAHWAAAAGFRIGGLYDQLWHALMRAPIPPPAQELAEDALPVYREEYRNELARQVRPLLRHAIRYWELTLLMVERTGVQTEWAERTREELERMRALILEQTDPTPAQEQASPPPSDPAPPPVEGRPSARLQVPVLPTALASQPEVPVDGAFAAVRPAPGAPSGGSVLALAH